MGHTFLQEKGLLLESQITSRRTLLCPLIHPYLSITNGSKEDNEFWVASYGCPLELVLILHLPSPPQPQVLTKDLELLKVKLRHLLQYFNTTKTMGLLYPHPKKRELTEFTVFGDSSFAPSGKHSQSGYTIHLSFGHVRHMVHWQSLREPKIAESPAESELYALASARKAARNFRLLIHEAFTPSLTMSLRCDNTATIAMLEEPGWRTRYISIYGEAARQEMLQHTMVVTYAATSLHQPW